MNGVIDWVVGVMRVIGAPGVGLATALETVFPPLPSEVVLPLAGYTASLGYYGVVAAVVWATIGSVVGAVLLYAAGAAWGADRLRDLADRIPLMSRRDVDRAIGWFARNGRKAVLLGRLVPGVRSLVSIPAGVEHMPVGQFVAYTTLGSSVWNGLLIGFGYELGSRWHVVEKYVGAASNVLYVLLAIAVVVMIARRLRHRRRH